MIKLALCPFNLMYINKAKKILLLFCVIPCIKQVQRRKSRCNLLDNPWVRCTQKLACLSRRGYFFKMGWN